MGTGANLVGGMLKNTAIGRAVQGIQTGAQAMQARVNPFANVLPTATPPVTPVTQPAKAPQVATTVPTSQDGMTAPPPYASAPGPGATRPTPSKVGNDKLYREFMDTVRSKGLTNPYGLAAVAATGQHESTWSDRNVFGKWDDPSESGVSGTSGGALSWRNERYQAMKRFVQQRGGDSAAAQAEFFMQENPGLIAALNKAESVDEAQRLMNNAWRFAGYNKAGGEAARRINTARTKVGEFGGKAGDYGVPLTTRSPNEVAGIPTTTTGVLARGTEFPAPPPMPTAASSGSQDARSKLTMQSDTASSFDAPAPRTPVAQALEQWKVNKTTRRMRGMSPAATIATLTAIGQMDREEQEAMMQQPRVRA